jgi:RNA polymerase sigma factor (sigma-70 family)
MGEPSKTRAAWLAEHILPWETLLRAWLARKSRGDLEVDDIIQDTYAILSELESVDNIRNGRNYAFRTAYSLIQNHLRRARIISFRPLTEADIFEVMSDTPSPETQASDRDELRLVENFISQLPGQCREVIVMRRIQGLSHRDIARRLNISENRVEKLVARALHLLLDAFGRGGRAGARASSNEGSEKSSVVIEETFVSREWK